MDNLFDVFRKHIEQRKEPVEKTVIGGGPKEFSEYRELVGQIKAYRDMISIVNHIEKDLMAKEEL